MRPSTAKAMVAPANMLIAATAEVRSLAIVAKSRMTRCIPCSFPLKRDAHRCSAPRGRSTRPLQSRNTPSKDAPLQAAADDPSRKPREWLTPRFKEEFVPSNDKPLVKKGDTATTSMVKREALTG